VKKLLIAATLTAAAVAAPPLLAQTGQKPAQTENCAMAGEHGKGRGHTAQMESRRAEMQSRMLAMHATMGSHEERRQGRDAQEEHQHQ